MTSAARRAGLGVFLALLFPGTWLPAQLVRELRLPLEDGRLSLLELSRAVLDEYGFDGQRLRFGDLQLNLGGVKGSLSLLGIRKVLGRTAKVKKVDRGKTLLIQIDRVEARILRQKVKDRLGGFLGTLIGQDLLAREYRLQLPPDLGQEEDYVLLIHGVDSRAEVFKDLRAHLAAQEPGYKSATFSYANDEAPDRIAKALSARLAAESKEHPKRRILIVAHSMGGLVARSMLESENLDPGNVSMLIMVGTPNHGSRLARLRLGMDLVELLKRPGGELAFVLPFQDGLGEAGHDLWPGSPFLQQLNARDRNPRVTYHLLLGNRAVLYEAQLAKLRQRVLDRAATGKGYAVYKDKLESYLTDLDELVHGKGDGAVSLGRGRLKGVEATIVPLHHLALIRAAKAGREQPVFAAIAKWLAADRGR